jgi:hypothetical protein
MGWIPAMSGVVRETATVAGIWGKRGTSDERGTIDYITQELIVRGARLVRRSAVFPRYPIRPDGTGDHAFQSPR